MYRKSRRRIVLEGKRERCAAMRAAKARKRMERAGGEGWKLVRSVLMLVMVQAGPDGRSMALRACTGAEEWYRCGSERAVRGALARMLWAKMMKATG